MGYRSYLPPAPLLIGYDPYRDLPPDHLVRLVESVVEMTLADRRKPDGCGQPEYDPRLLVKVLTYGYATGVRSSRQLERLCQESLPYLFLTRGDAPSYHTFCTARLQRQKELEQVWEALFAVAGAAGIRRLGRITLDSTKLWANASPESVLTQDEFVPVLGELQRILAEAAAVDAREEAEGGGGQTRLGKPVEREVMRDILRRVRRRRKHPGGTGAQGEPVPPGEQTASSAEEASSEGQEPSDGEEASSDGEDASSLHTPQMLERIKVACAAIEEGLAQGAKHVCLTDPDARMMYGGRVRSIRECHSLEVATDNGLLVACASTQEGTDTARLLPLVEAAREQEPEGIVAVDADSGYYSGEGVAHLVREGIDVCIPDTHTACDLHRGQPVGTQRAKARGGGEFTYDADADAFTCQAGQTLSFVQERQAWGQMVRVYRAEADCLACSLSEPCLVHKDARHRTLKVGQDHALLSEEQARFAEPQQQERYRHRAEQVETVFGFWRATLGYTRWLLRGKRRVACEARLLGLAYQMRKIHTALTRPKRLAAA